MSHLQGGSELDFSIKNHQYSSLAQSVERRTVNPQVVGSSPTRGAIEALKTLCFQGFFLFFVGSSYLNQ